ncbi:RecB family exonuclease [Streptomyces flavofungini]|uniref:RecB family exonuclease n=1 Tax=Streptomyces flavofungini TaxID=68200 RepID=UPI0025AF48B5|nr:PD-(D/E)XK nuclease family protein [Streptomyces flavofungini]WJV49927.1 PD-(D/E)XK nuclease family protein [Streptomyces flavofungini]
MGIETATRSVSQVEQYEKCPYRFYLRRVVRIPPRPAAWSIQGTAFHAACEAYERSERVMTCEEVADVYSETYTDLTRAALSRTPDTEHWLRAKGEGTQDIEDRYALGVAQTRAYVEWALGRESGIWRDSRGVPAIELHLTAPLGGVIVQGYIDQLTTDEAGALNVRDLKTGTTRSKFQLATYGALVRAALGEEVNRGDWYMAKTGKPSRAVDISEGAGHKVSEKFRAMDEGVKRGDFPAKAGFECRFCDVSHACSSNRYR